MNKETAQASIADTMTAVPKSEMPIVLEVAHFGNHYILPQKGKPRSIGYDLTVPEDVKVPAHSRFKIPLNIAINLPEGIEAKIEPRSGFELNGMEGYGTREVPNLLFGIIPFLWKTITGIHRWDCDALVGKIDPGYTDNINVIIKNNDEQFLIRRGTRIAQISFYKVISPEFVIVDKLSCASRGGGLGSSGTVIPPDRQPEFIRYCEEIRKAKIEGRIMPPFGEWLAMRGMNKKDIPFSEYYATRSPEERAEIDASPLGKVFNEKAQQDDNTGSN